MAFIPFPTRALAADGNTQSSATQSSSANQSVIILYAATIGLTGLIWLANWWYVASRHRFIEPDLDPTFIRNVYFRGVVFPLVFLLSIVVALFSPSWATNVWLLAAVLSFAASIRFQRAGHKAQDE